MKSYPSKATVRFGLRWQGWTHSPFHLLRTHLNQRHGTRRKPVTGKRKAEGRVSLWKAGGRCERAAWAVGRWTPVRADHRAEEAQSPGAEGQERRGHKAGGPAPREVQAHTRLSFLGGPSSSGRSRCGGCALCSVWYRAAPTHLCLPFGERLQGPLSASPMPHTGERPGKKP